MKHEKETKQPETVTLTVKVPPRLASIFEEICQEKGRKPEDIIYSEICSHIQGFLDGIARAQDPRSVAIGSAVASMVKKLTPAQRRRVIGFDRWPWVDKGAPASLKAAKAVAVRRGRRQAIKEAETGRMLRAGKVPPN